MKHFRKVCSVLLVAVMVAVMLPSFLTFESVSVDAATAGELINGGFESGYTTTTQSTGSGSYAKINEGWTQDEWATDVVTTKQAGSYGIEITGHNSVANAVAVEQIVPVNTNATYSLTFYVKGRSYKVDCNTVYNTAFTYSLDLGTTSGSFGTSVASKVEPSISSTSWTEVTATIDTGSNKYLRIRLIAKGDDNGVSHADSFVLTATNEGDTGTHAAPSLKAFATDKNRPNSDANNIIVQPGFESTTNAQWNTTAFLTNGVSVKEDASIAHSGSKYLHYYRGSVAPTTWSTFEITCPTAGEYVFSAWVRTPHLSASNQGKASIGVIDRDTGKFLTYSKPSGDDDAYYGHYSTPEIQIRSTATDDDWHLRSVVFYVGAANANVKIGMYGLSSTMYVDDISVHLLSNGVTYSGDQTGTLSASTSVTNKYCESEDNLIPDCNMNTSLSKNFWSKSSGWNNGFLEFGKDEQDASHGKVLHYKGANPGSNKLYNYIKFIYVEPNTSYTVSFDYRVVSAGNQLMFIDNNIVSPKVFHTPNLGSASNSWKTYAFTFNSGNYNRIGIVFRDHASAEAYFDDFRFFKTSDGISTEPEEENPIVEGTADLAPYETGTSRMEMDSSYEGQTAGTLGLAFRFNLECAGVNIDKDNGHLGDYTNGTVKPFENSSQTYKLVTAGAVMTNNAAVGQDEAAFVRGNQGESVNGKNTVIDVNATKLFSTYHKEYYKDSDVYTEYGIVYAIRIKNIPQSHKGTTIYARPYYVYETTDGDQITIYGDVVYDAYEKIPDINDGWLEWD